MPIISPKHLTDEPTIFKEAPYSKGVYALYGPDKTVIYYGRSGINTNIREKILSHCRGKEMPCTEASWYFNFELTNAPNKRKKELLEEHRKQKSSLPKCNEGIV